MNDALFLHDIRDIPFNIYIKTLTGKTVSITVKPYDTIADVKMILENVIGISTDKQRLLFEGKDLNDKNIVSDYGIGNNFILHFA